SRNPSAQRRLERPLALCHPGPKQALAKSPQCSVASHLGTSVRLVLAVGKNASGSNVTGLGNWHRATSTALSGTQRSFRYDGTKGRIRSRLPQEVAMLTREAMTAHAGHGATIASWRHFTGKHGDRRTSSEI